MKTFVLAVAAAALGLTLPHAGEAASPVRAVPGFFNPASGMFTPTLVMPAAGAPALRIGKVKVVIKLTIETSIGTDQPVSCEASIQSNGDASYTNSAGGSNIVTRSGSSGTAVILIPYDWTMTPATTEQASVSVSCATGSSYGSGSVGHNIYFAGSVFTLSATAGTVTTLNFTGSM